MKFNKEIKVALFVIIAGTMLYTGFSFLKGIDFLSSSHRYFVNYSNITGLQVSNSVMLNGLAVGRVGEIKILEDNNHIIQVALDIDKHIVLGDSTKAIIATPDLLSAKAIVITLGNPKKPLPENSYLIGEVEKGISEKLSERADPIITNLETSIKRVNLLMSEQNIKAISAMIVNLEATTRLLNGMIETNSSNINHTTANIKNLTSSLVETEKQLKPILIKVNSIADSLNKMQLAAAVENTSRSVAELNKILVKVNKGEGTIGKLVNDDSLYINLNHTARDLDKLLVDLKTHPKHYVHFSLFGKKEKKSE